MTMKSSKSSKAVKPTRDPSPDRPIAQPPRQRAACESCHSSKVKCTGGSPCARCNSSRTECVYKLVSRIGKPKGARNKSTLRRLEYEAQQAEQAARLEAEKARAAGSPRERMGFDAEDSSSSYFQGNPQGYLMGSADPHNQSWRIYSRNWPVDSEMPGGSFQLLSDPVTSPGEWVYGSEIGTVDCHPSLMSTAPLDDAFFEGAEMALLDDPTMHINKSGGLQSRLPSLTSESSYTSSPWSGSAAAPASLSDDHVNFSKDAFTIPPTNSYSTHGSCHCAANLASHLCSFRHPEALNSTAHSTDGFLRNTDHLLYAISSFLDCQLCEKNSLALSLTTSIFATFGQLFTALTGKSRQSSPGGSSPNLTASTYLNRQLSFGGYQSTSENEGAIRSMLASQVVHKWREACYKANRLLEHLQARAHGVGGYGLEGSDFNLEMASDGEGTPLWGPTDIDSFARVVSRVESDLAIYT